MHICIKFGPKEVHILDKSFIHYYKLSDQQLREAEIFHMCIFILINKEYEIQKLTSKKLYSEIWMDPVGKISIKRKYFRIGEI